MDDKHVHVKISAIALVLTILSTAAIHLDNPNFSQPIANVTAAVGREAILECVVQNLGVYKVAWLRVDTQTILTIHSHIITKNHRIGVTHSEYKTWYLHIKEVRESDMGWYMCQINTDPMKSQIGYLDVVVPPDIIDYQTSPDMVIQEGLNVSLRCVARGSPTPTIVWRKESGETIPGDDAGASGSVLNINRVSRKQMGPYLCIASNGVPPSVSKRITLIVHFPPMIWIQYQLIGAYDGQHVSLECHSEAYPKSINYWTRDTGDIVPRNEKYEPILVHDTYKVHMKLIINKIEPGDYGIYKCISKNAIGETDGTINVYRIPRPAFSNKTSMHRKKNNSMSNDVTYQLSSSTADRPGPLFLGDEQGSGTRIVGNSGILSFVIAFMFYVILY